MQIDWNGSRKQLFDPEEREIEGFGCFTKANAQVSVFTSTRYNPVPVFISNYHDAPEVKIPVVLDLAMPCYFMVDIGQQEDLPNWYFEGTVLTHHLEEPWRVRIHVSSYHPEFDDEEDSFIWQKIVRSAPFSASSWSFH